MKSNHDTFFDRAAILAALFAIVVAVLMLAHGAHSEPMKTENLIIETSRGDLTFDVEVAREPRQKAMGLMFRSELPAMKGMLFPYEETGEITMWMKNTLISLDMVFIGADGRVVGVAARTEPMSEKIISSNVPAAGVLEIAGGEAERLGIVPGDLVRHSHFGTALR